MIDGFESNKPHGFWSDRIALLDYLLGEEDIAPSTRQMIQHRPDRGDSPLSFSQQRMWFLNQLEPGPHYNDCLVLRIDGQFCVDVLEKSIKEIVRRHEILRTTFIVKDGATLQSVSPDASVPVRRVSLGEVPAREREALAVRLASEEVRNPFDLAQGPLLRASLFSFGEGDHLFVLAIHQIVNDGWSQGVLIRELLSLYRSFLTGNGNIPPELPIQYGDYAHWQRLRFDQEYLEPHLAYWKNQLAGKLPVLELPGDHQRPCVPLFRGARQYIEMPQSLIESLRNLSRMANATLFMTFLAALKILIYRYTMEEDVLIGFPTANRLTPETEDLIGIFINPVVLRTALAGQLAFMQLLAQVREVALGAYEHQEMPFEQLVAELKPERDLNHSPLFQVMFDYQNAPTPRLELPGVSLSRVEIDTGIAKFDLTLELREEPDRIHGWFEYNSDLFDPATAARMAEHFQNILRDVAFDPGKRLSEIRLLSETDLNKVLVEWNSTQVDYPPECIHDSFEDIAARIPDQVALLSEGKEMTFGQLNARANQIAHFLLECGVGTDRPVGICMERSFDLVAGLLGILKAGAAYLPLDPAYPRERLSFMLEDASVSVLLTQSEIASSLPTVGCRMVCVDSQRGPIRKQSCANPKRPVAAEDIAYVIYTSGSTGKPKGVLGTHLGAMNRCRWMWAAYPFDEGEVCCQKTSLSFVDSVWEVFGPLLQGVRSFLIPDRVLKDGFRLVKALREQAVTRIVVVPSLLRVLLETHEDLQSQIPALRYCVSSGEALSTDLCEKFRQSMPDCILINLYGSSEVSADSTCYDATEHIAPKPVLIGRPISNTQVYLLDKDKNPVPVGVPGEIYIGGAGLARGYLNRPELTTERFLENPFVKEPMARLYRTGDLGRYLSDGNIQFVGRVDAQIKVRGHRIEPGEIETSLRLHPAVIDAAVVARSEENEDSRLVAYVVLDKKNPSKHDELRSWLKAKLPTYMLPSRFVAVDSLPRTGSEKVDYKMLATIDGNEREGAEIPSDSDPNNMLEVQLGKIWERLLGIELVGTNDDFFDLGGHSLLAVKLFAQIRKRFGIELPFATLFKASTIRQLSAVIQQGEHSAKWASLLPIQPHGSRPPLYCVHAAGGSAMFYRTLANHLGPDQPVFGLQSRGLDSAQALPNTIEEMASHYIDEIRAFQPDGPYRIVGRCLGGYIAFEMAQQLRDQGEEVDFLAIVDSSPPKSMYELPKKRQRKPLSHYVRRTIYHLTKGQLLGVAAAAANWKRRTASRNVARSYQRLRTQVFGGSQLRNLQRLEQANLKIGSNYRARKYAGSITLIRSSEFNALNSKDGHLRWSDLAASGFRSYVVPGKHLTMFEEPEVQGLANKLSACIPDRHSLADSHAELASSIDASASMRTSSGNVGMTSSRK